MKPPKKVNLPALWKHVRPLVVMAGKNFDKKVKPYVNAFGKKVKPYFNPFVEAIDEIVCCKKVVAKKRA